MIVSRRLGLKAQSECLRITVRTANVEPVSNCSKVADFYQDNGESIDDIEKHAEVTSEITQ
jgi:hypothetical protein